MNKIEGLKEKVELLNYLLEGETKVSIIDWFRIRKNRNIA